MFTNQSLKSPKQKKLTKRYKLPTDLKNIPPSPKVFPSMENLKQEWKRLQDEFYEYNLTENIDLYNHTYAMSKDIYYNKKYMDGGLKSRIRKWVDDFNTANYLFKEITGKHEKFIHYPTPKKN